MASSSRWLPCVLLASAVTLTACTSGTGSPPVGGRTASGIVGPGGEVAIPPAPATPTPTTLPPEVYREQLDDVREPIREALADLAAARNRKALRERAEKAETALSDAAARLEALAPPPEVAAEHATFVSAMRALSAGIGTIRLGVDSGQVCTASGVLASLGRTGELKSLDAAGEALADRGDYPADVVSIKARKQTSRRLPNGRYLRSGSRTGRATFSIHNGGTRDAVITLARGKKPVISVYVRRKSKFTVAGVRDGTYRVYYTTGIDWDAKARSFTRSCVFQRFEDPFPFKTTRTATQILWKNWQITLHQVRGGNARTAPVDPEDFPA